MNNLKKLLVMSASIAAIGLVGGFSVFADCEDEDTYVCEEQTDFDLDENQDLEEEEQDLDDEEDPFMEAAGNAFKAIFVSETLRRLADTTPDDVMTIGDIAEVAGDIAHAVADAARRGMEYNANHPTDPSNPWNVD